MKKITTLLFGILLAGMALQAQDVKPFKGDNGKYGVKNEKGKVIVEPKYDYINWFREGMAFVNKGGVEDVDNWLGGAKGGKWGVIDSSGKEIVPPKYHEAGDFKEGLARVKLNGKWGFINKAGKEVISLKYAMPGVFSRDYR